MMRKCFLMGLLAALCVYPIEKCMGSAPAGELPESISSENVETVRGIFKEAMESAHKIKLNLLSCCIPFCCNTGEKNRVESIKNKLKECENEEQYIGAVYKFISWVGENESRKHILSLANKSGAGTYNTADAEADYVPFTNEISKSWKRYRYSETGEGCHPCFLSCFPCCG